MIYNETESICMWSMTAHRIYKTEEIIKVSNYFIVHDIIELHIRLLKN